MSAQSKKARRETVSESQAAQFLETYAALLRLLYGPRIAPNRGG